MKCYADNRRQQEHDLEIRRQAIIDTLHFNVIQFIQFLGDKRGWKQESLIQMCKYIISHAESIEGEYTTFKEAEEDVWERYGIKWDGDHIYVEDKPKESGNAGGS